VSRRNRVLLVDDEPDIRAIVALAISLADDGLILVGEAPDGVAAVEMWRELRPDSIVLDLVLPDLDGLEVARQILSEQPDQVIVLYSAYLSPEITERAARLGVKACVNKMDHLKLAPLLWAFAVDAEDTTVR
jgi:CheY-like chemotaxis protein